MIFFIRMEEFFTSVNIFFKRLLETHGKQARCIDSASHYQNRNVAFESRVKPYLL